MSLTEQTVKKVAHLSRIRMDDAEIQKYCGELNKIFSWIDKLSEVDTENVEPLQSINFNNLPLREDKVTEGKVQEVICKAAPESAYGFVSVPKFVE